MKDRPLFLRKHASARTCKKVQVGNDQEKAQSKRESLSKTRLTIRHLYYEIKIELRSFKSRERINEKGDGSYSGFGYLSLFSDPINWQHGAKENNCNFATFNRIVKIKTIFIQKGPHTCITNVD